MALGTTCPYRHQPALHSLPLHAPAGTTMGDLLCVGTWDLRKEMRQTESGPLIAPDTVYEYILMDNSIHADGVRIVSLSLSLPPESGDDAADAGVWKWSAVCTLGAGSLRLHPPQALPAEVTRCLNQAQVRATYTLLGGLLGGVIPQCMKCNI